MQDKYIHTNQLLKQRRQDLRNNATPEERLLWEDVRGKKLGYKFQRQHSIGPYIADFYCPAKKLIIELDGSQHLDTKEYDEERTNYFISLNLKVLRFWNNEIRSNLDGVIMKIKQSLS